MLSLIPPSADLDTPKILKQLVASHRALAELKGLANIIPNQDILIRSLVLQEAKDSSAIENIITTHDELYQSSIATTAKSTSAAKEVQNYAKALKVGFELISESQLLTINHMVQIQELIEENDAGIRRLPGTALKNEQTGETIYTPPQDHATVLELLKNLEQFINDDHMSDWDPLVKMAIIHYQFESIHPFYDGNGRTGRIINILYLVLKGFLDIPILYLSQYIIQNKSEYYRHLRMVESHDAWEDWTLYMLKGVEETAHSTSQKVRSIHNLLIELKHQIRSQYKFYSQDLVNNLFKHPYTKTELLEQDLQITRLTASKYLEALTESGILDKVKLGRHNYFINVALFNILTAPGEDSSGN